MTTKLTILILKMFSFCMYCCKERCAAIAITVLSVLFMLTSGATIYLMHRTQTDSFVWDLQSDPLIEEGGAAGSPSIDTIKLIVYWGVIGLCGSSILTGFLGMATAYQKSCCTISLYSFFTLMLTVVMLGLGGFLMTVNIASNMHITSYCKYNSQQNHGTNFTLNFARYFLSYVDDYRDATNDMVMQYMCTPLCPCVAIANRSQVYPTGLNRMESLNNFEGSYSQFSSCYDDLRQDNRIRENLSPTLISLIQTLEDKYQCSGLCEVPKFGFFKDVRQGGPRETCEKPIAQLYNMTLGLLSLGLLVTGLIIFLAFNAQYGLWRRRFSKDKPNQSSSSNIKDRHMNYMVEDTSKL